MILFIAKNSNNAYTLNINTPNGHIVYMKFDTGASFTAIPYSLLKDVIKDKEVNNFKYYNHTKTFKTASSKDVKGVLCSIENISIGALKFPIFYFYLIFNTNRTVGLLGYEVIDNCKFSHDVDGNIIISDFDAKKYKNDTSKICTGLHEISFDECYDMCKIHEITDETELELVNSSGRPLSDEDVIKELFQYKEQDEE